MSPPNIKAQHSMDRIPLDTRRIVIFYTNAYRVMTAKTSLADCRAKAIQLRHREQAARVFVQASPTGIWEVGAHVADSNDPGFEHCLNSLVVLGAHAVDPKHPQGGINLFPDADSTVCRELFHAVPPDHEMVNQNLGSFVKHVVKYAPDLSDPRAQQNIKHIASAVAATEKQRLTLMQTVVAHCDPGVAKQFFENKSTREVANRSEPFSPAQRA